MALKKLSKDYLLSSTPLQSPGDSGYFGSGDRRNKSNSDVLGSCSPIQESNLQGGFFEISPPSALEKKLNFEKLAKNELLCSIEINDLSELEFTCPSSDSGEHDLQKPSLSVTDELLCNSTTEDFTCPGDSGEHELHKPSLSVSSEVSCNSTEETSHASYSLSDSDIHYKIFDFDLSDLAGLNHLNYRSTIHDKNISRIINSFKIDFIKELDKRNCFQIISVILSCLSAKELCIASCVSKVWNKVICSDPKANCRRKNLIAERLCFLNGPSKENRYGMKYGPPKEQKKGFSNLTNTIEISAPKKTTVSNSRFHSFMKEAKNSKEKLIKCPSCSFPSKCSRGNSYICTRCSYHFCSQCFNPIFNSHNCRKPQLPNIVVGSKKSKKNLRRL